MITKYPLSWPDGWPRTPEHQRKYGKFNKKGRQQTEHGSWQTTKDISVSDAIERLLIQLDRMGVGEEFIISTNLVTRMDGLPKSGQRMPADPGAAVYWEDQDGKQMSIAIDRYEKVEHNLAAIAATLEALRGIERWGGAQIIERAFMGFAALEAPNAEPAKPWWEVLDVSASAPEHEIEHAFRRARRKAHPDAEGGSEMAFIHVQEAYKTAKTARGFS